MPFNLKMRFLVRLAAGLACALGSVIAHPGTAQLSPRSAYFPNKDLMQVGIYYYPEAWPEEQWDRDFKAMKAMGFEFTHFAEFAWARLEPQEGKYDFAWLDKAVELAHKNGLKVIMCTPTPAPPVWLTNQYPDAVVVDENGRFMLHGGRAHGSHSSPKFRQYTAKIVAELGKRYGKDTRIWGWQLDNEPSHYGTYDHSNDAILRFREWLKAKYTTLPALNKAWGAAFWSNTYSEWYQIRTPNPKEQVQGVNPHSLQDFKRFSADETAEFLTLQYQELRKHISPQQWITSNFMPMHPPVDPWRSANLDLVTYTTYPVAGYTAGKGENGFRVGDWNTIPYLTDYTRSINGLTGCMELQPGQVNWGSYNPQPLPGVIRAWMWSSFAGGSKLMCAYRFRQPLFGYEQYHNGMKRTDGVTTNMGGKEWETMMAELAKIKAQYNPKAVAPATYEKRRTLLLSNRDNAWNINYAQQTPQFVYDAHVVGYYSMLKQLNCPVDFATDAAQVDKYPVVVAPAYHLIDAAFVSKLKAYVENGGHLILTTRSGFKDKNGHLWEDKYSAPILPLIGAEIDFFDMLPKELMGKLSLDGKEYSWNNWAEILKPAKGTEVWANYTDQFYGGQASVTHRKLGKGTVTYIGVDTDDKALEKAVLTKVYGKAGIALENLPEGLFVDYRDGYGVAVNYNQQPAKVPIPTGAKLLLGSAELKQADVAVWLLP